MPTFRPVLAGLIVLAVVAACGGSAATPALPSQPPVEQPSAPAEATPTPEAPAGATTTPAAAAPGTALSACELVTPADIEAVLELDGGSVAAGALTEKGTVLDPAVNECKYDGEEWGGLSVLVTPTDGVNTFNAVNKTFGEDAEALDIGDGALWFEDNDRGYFLKGSVLVLLQFNYLTEGTGSFRDPTVSLGEVAVARI
jgi:hypothetical protein